VPGLPTGAAGFKRAVSPSAALCVGSVTIGLPPEKWSSQKCGY